MPFAPLPIAVSYGLGSRLSNLLALIAVAMALLLAAPSPLAGERPLRIVAIGDSLVAGYGLYQDDGLVPQLNRWLEAHGAPEAEVLNMGVSGDTTAGGLARLDWALADGADAVILALGANDLLRGVDPAETRRNLDGALAALGARGLPVLMIGIEAPLNYGPDYKRAFDAIFPELAAGHGALLVWWGIGGLAEEPSLLQEDRLHPNAAGVARLVERLGPAILQLIERVKR